MPQPAAPRRHALRQPPLDGFALLGCAPGGRLLGPAAAALRSASARALVTSRGEAQRRAAEGGLEAAVWDSSSDPERRFGALVFDASGIANSGRLREAYEFLHPVVRRLDSSGRVVVLATPPEAAGDRAHAVAQRALEGLVRSVAKEVGGGSTAQLVYVSPDAEGNLESTLRFLLSARSAYVAGQVVRIGAGQSQAPADWDRALDDLVAVVTGASRGIGLAIAEDRKSVV